MATVFYHAIHEALDNNAIPATVPFSVGASVCDKVEGTGVDAGGLTQRGSGYDDGIYYHDSIGEGVRTSFPDQRGPITANYLGI